jgi:chitosanase
MKIIDKVLYGFIGGLLIFNVWMHRGFVWEKIFVPTVTQVNNNSRYRGTSMLNISDTQRNVILSLTSCAENSIPDLQWNYAENIDDGRGVTFGTFGFTSGTYDGTMVLKALQNINPDHILVSYLPAFVVIDALLHTKGLSNSTKGLESFIQAWERYGAEPEVIQAQKKIWQKLYWEPSLDIARAYGLSSPLALAIIYDSTINHGADGTRDLITKAQLSSIMGNLQTEKGFLAAFLKVRETHIQATWPEGVDRVKMFERLIDAGKWDLNTPLAITIYGDHFVLKPKEAW